jgi:outer membrane protein assembly factor BamB
MVLSLLSAFILALYPPLLEAAEGDGVHLLSGGGAIDELDNLVWLPPREDQPARLVLGDIHGFLHVYEQRADAFEEVWTSEYLESAISGLFVVDINDDEQDELVVSTGKGRLYYLDLKTYRTLWSNPSNEYERITSLIIHNVDEDEQPELIFCADGRLVIYDAHHQFEEWGSDETNLEATDLLVGDVDGDGADEIVLNNGYVFDARFHDLEWQSPQPFGQRMGVLDLDNDGIVELIGEFNGRFIRIFDIDLRREKSIEP